MAPAGRGVHQCPTACELGVYCCGQCRTPLQLEMVVSADIDRVDDNATGYVVFEHFCTCQPGTLHVSRGWGSHPSFLALFGRQPALPYRAPFRWQTMTDDDPTLARWRWEVGQVRDWHDFVLFLDDAAHRGV